MNYLQKTKNEYKEVERRDSRCNYQNEVDKTCFQHDIQAIQNQKLADELHKPIIGNFKDVNQFISLWKKFRLLLLLILC